MQRTADLSKLDEADLAIERPRATLADAAADKLREFILLEVLKPGASISEREVAGALGISRTPLRQALAILEQEGLVRYTVSRRPQVANPSLAEITENLVVMGALEALAGELACVAASAKEIDAIVALESRLRVGANKLEALEFFSTDMQLHTAIVQASGNHALAATHRQYNARLWRARFVSSQRRDERQQTLAEHTAFVQALADRDAVATAAGLRAHLSSAVNNIANAMKEASGPDSASS